MSPHAEKTNDILFGCAIEAREKIRAARSKNTVLFAHTALGNALKSRPEFFNLTFSEMFDLMTSTKHWLCIEKSETWDIDAIEILFGTDVLFLMETYWPELKGNFIRRAECSMKSFPLIPAQGPPSRFNADLWPKLISMLVWMQVECGDKPIFLSMQVGADILRCDKKVISVLLKHAASLGYIKIVESNSRNKATSYMVDTARFDLKSGREIEVKKLPPSKKPKTVVLQPNPEKIPTGYSWSSETHGLHSSQGSHGLQDLHCLKGYQGEEKREEKSAPEIGIALVSVEGTPYQLTEKHRETHQASFPEIDVMKTYRMLEERFKDPAQRRPLNKIPDVIIRWLEFARQKGISA